MFLFDFGAVSLKIMCKVDVPVSGVYTVKVVGVTTSRVVVVR